LTVIVIAHCPLPSQSPEFRGQHLSSEIPGTKTCFQIHGHIDERGGFGKNHLGPDDKAELTASISQYRKGLQLLVVPITLLRHHFRHYPSGYIGDSYYMQPHPAELMLLNHL